VKVLDKKSSDYRMDSFVENWKAVFYLPHHPNVLTCYGICTQEGITYRCSELGIMSVREYLKHNVKIEVPKLFHFITQMALGLNYLHLCSFIYRGLSLSNFIMFNDDLIKIDIPDHGRQVVDTDQSLSGGVGALYFRAPEQDTPSYSSTCDVWGLGINIGALISHGRQMGDGERERSMALEKDKDEHAQKWMEESEPRKIIEDLKTLIGSQGLLAYVKRKLWALGTAKGEVACFFDLLRDCLQFDPTARPSMMKVTEKLVDLTKSYKSF